MSAARAKRGFFFFFFFFFETPLETASVCSLVRWGRFSGIHQGGMDIASQVDVDSRDGGSHVSHRDE